MIVGFTLRIIEGYLVSLVRLVLLVSVLSGTAQLIFKFFCAFLDKLLESFFLASQKFLLFLF